MQIDRVVNYDTCRFAPRPAIETGASCVHSVVEEQRLSLDGLGSSRLVDLTLEISSGMPTHASFPPPLIEPFATHESSIHEGLGTESDRHSYAVNQLTMMEHVGTHVDAPLHFGPAGAGIDEIGLERFHGPALCLDLRHIPDLGDIDTRELEAAERAASIRIASHVVLLCTGFHARHWPRPEVVSRNPGLTAEATRWLADRGSRVHGVEGPSTDKAGTREFPNHRVCRDLGLIHYEWLINLELLVGIGQFYFLGLPLKLRHGTGSPVRAVALVGKSQSSQGRHS
jgi:kynurenine formamidase